MMATCPECGKRHVVTWPDLNPFRRGDRFYCSHGCWELSVLRDMHQIKEIALNRRQRKHMKLKKDGTPAAKPGRKPQKAVEIPEQVPTVKLDGPLNIETPEPEKVKFICTTMEYKTTGISTPIGDWQYFKKSGYLDWTPIGENAVVSLNLEEWKELIKLFPEVLKVLGVEM